MIARPTRSGLAVMLLLSIALAIQKWREPPGMPWTIVVAPIVIALATKWLFSRGR